MLKIRLTRMGKKHQPTYRIVVTPKENPVKGQYLDLLGTYQPLRGEVNLNTERALEWLNKGAKPSQRIARLLTGAGVKHKSIKIEVYPEKGPKKADKPKQVMPAKEQEDKSEEAPTPTTEETPQGESAAETPVEIPEIEKAGQEERQ